MKSKDKDFTEVWGDTVNLMDMFVSIMIGSIISVGFFLLSKILLGQIDADKKLIDGYAMLVGIGGCLVSGVICSILFKPKRLIVEYQNSYQNIQEIINDLITDNSDYESINNLPEDTKSELELLGLKRLLLDIEKSRSLN